MDRNHVETVMGAVVLLVAGFFLAFAYSSASVSKVSGYEIWGQFDRIDGLALGSDVRVSGVKVGSVSSETLDSQTFLAVVRLSVDPKVKLPKDTIAIVSSDGLLGGKYLALVPGGADETIPPGGRIEHTQASVSLEDMLGKVIYSVTQKQGGDSNPPSSQQPQQPPAQQSPPPKK